MTDFAHDFLRVYEPHELEADGYPTQWHKGGILTTYRDDGTNTLRVAEREPVPAIKDWVREQAGHRCERCHHPYPPGIAETHPRGEWTPCDERCTHGGPLRVETFESGFGAAEAQWRILTVHHLNGDKADCRWWNLMSACQKCHLTIQGRVVMERAFILEHSEWMKPHAAGWYAVKYLDEDLTREETMERLDELLGLEALV